MSTQILEIVLLHWQFEYPMLESFANYRISLREFFPINSRVNDLAT